MRYMLMSNIDPRLMGALTPEEFQATVGRFVAFTKALADSGVLLAAEQLTPADTATTVRMRDGDVLLTDGPYAEVAEYFGGFWIIDVPDLDTALKHSQDCPATTLGSVEVRSLVELG